jgi:hypothetical protein
MVYVSIETMLVNIKYVSYNVLLLVISVISIMDALIVCMIGMEIQLSIYAWLLLL